MELKEKINKDYLAAFKSKNLPAKSALSMLKAKITEAEKANGNKELNDSEIMKLIISTVKQRSQSIEDFKKAGREDLVATEEAELVAVKEYLPKQLSDEEIRSIVTQILRGISDDNPNKKIGMCMGSFTKTYAGQADSKRVMEIIKETI